LIRLKVMGPVVAQHRPRITTVGKFPRTYPVKVDQHYREKTVLGSQEIKHQGNSSDGAVEGYHQGLHSAAEVYLQDKKILPHSKTRYR